MNNLPKVVTQRCLEQDLNPRPTDREPKCLTVTPPRHPRRCTKDESCPFVTIIGFPPHVSPVQALTLSIHDDLGRPLLRCPGIVPCIMAFSTQGTNWFPYEMSKIGQLSSFHACQKVSIYCTVQYTVVGFLFSPHNPEDLPQRFHFRSIDSLFVKMLN